MTGKLWFGIAKLGFHKCQFCYLRVMRIHLIRFRRDKEMAEAKSNGKEKVIYRNKRKENACLVDKEMAEAKSKGKEKVIYTNKRKEKACPVIEYHREKNVGVVIREEWDRNLIRLNMDTNVVEAMSKGKANLLSETKGKENAFPLHIPIMNCKTGKVQLSVGEERMEVDVYSVSTLGEDDEESEGLCLIDTLIQEHIDTVLYKDPLEVALTTEEVSFLSAEVGTFRDMLEVEDECKELCGVAHDPMFEPLGNPPPKVLPSLVQPPKPQMLPPFTHQLTNPKSHYKYLPIFSPFAHLA